MKPVLLELSFGKTSNSTNSVSGVVFAPELFESIKHSTISKLAKVNVPDTTENHETFFSLPSITSGAASNL